jgi:predicted nucleic-acid-binding Zn-ribbon protein
MGLYIEIINTIPCPKCKKPLTDWQCKELSYDGYPVAILLQRYKLNNKMSGEIHTICPKCGMVEYSISKGKLTDISDYLIQSLKQSDEDIKAGRVTSFKDGRDALSYLDREIENEKKQRKD